MKLKDISQEELDLMSYDELAALILEESRKKMKIFDLFKKVCNILNLSDAEFENKIADFFEESRQKGVDRGQISRDIDAWRTTFANNPEVFELVSRLLRA